MVGSAPRLFGSSEIGRNKVTESVKLLKVCVYFGCLHLTEDAPSAKPNCGLINLCIEGAKASQQELCTGFRCNLCQNVNAPVPRWIWRSS